MIYRGNGSVHVLPMFIVYLFNGLMVYFNTLLISIIGIHFPEVIKIVIRQSILISIHMTEQLHVSKIYMRGC